MCIFLASHYLVHSNKIKLYFEKDTWPAQDKEYLCELLNKGEVKSEDLDFSDSIIENIDLSGLPLK